MLRLFTSHGQKEDCRSGASRAGRRISSRAVDKATLGTGRCSRHRAHLSAEPTEPLSLGYVYSCGVVPSRSLPIGHPCWIATTRPPDQSTARGSNAIRMAPAPSGGIPIIRPARGHIRPHRKPANISKIAIAFTWSLRASLTGMHRSVSSCILPNRTAFDYMGFQFLNRRIDAGSDPLHVMTRMPDDCYGLFLNSPNAEWWGWRTASHDMAKYSTTLTPAEKRVLDTIEWVAVHYKIDRNRIYLSGVSMGGCGTLGIGLPHGDIFATILADVPAGTEYVALRRGFPAALASGASPAEQDIWTEKISGLGLARSAHRRGFFSAER